MYLQFKCSGLNFLHLVPGKEKKLKVAYEENPMDDDEDYEPTAILGMMSEFQQQFGMASNHATSTKDKSTNLLVSATAQKPENSFMQQSLVASFMEQEENLSLLGKSKKDISMVKN